MSDPFIMVAPNGARRTKDDHPNLPMTLPEIISEARACFKVGASALHLHVRDEEGRHSLDSGRYLEALSELKIHLPDLPVQITTEAVGLFSVADQLVCLEKTTANWASLSIREIARDPDLAERVYQTCADLGTRVQHILYDHADAALLADWLEAGTVLPEQRSVLLVLGRYSANQTSNKEDIAPFVACLPDLDDWMLCAFGSEEHDCLIEAARLGGTCRVGFENSLVDARGRAWGNNAASVRALKAALEPVL